MVKPSVSVSVLTDREEDKEAGEVAEYSRRRKAVPVADRPDMQDAEVMTENVQEDRKSQEKKDDVNEYSRRRRPELLVVSTPVEARENRPTMIDVAMMTEKLDEPEAEETNEKSRKRIAPEPRGRFEEGKQQEEEKEDREALERIYMSPRRRLALEPLESHAAEEDKEPVKYPQRRVSTPISATVFSSCLSP